MLRYFPLLLVVALLFGCGGSSSSNSPISFYKEPTMAVLISGSVCDVADPAKSFPVEITVSAPAGVTVYTKMGTTLPTPLRTTSNTIIELGLINHPATDVTLTITAKAVNNDYVTKSASVNILKSSATAAFDIRMEAIALDSAAIPGLSKNVAKVATGSAGLFANLSTSTGTTGAATKVFIPSGAIVTAGSEPLSGLLTLSTSNYNPQSSSALALAPGDGRNFITAGFTDVSIHDSKGNRATSLSTDMTIRIGIPAETLNPETGDYIAAGQSITVYTFRPATGTWDEETVTPVQVDKNGNMFVEFKANHFSYWNLGFKLGVTVCSAPKVLNLKSSNGVDHKAALTLKVVGPPALGTFYTAAKPAGDTSVTVANVPSKYGLTYSAYYATDLTTPVGTLTTTATDACITPRDLTIKIPAMTTYNWTVNQKCTYTDQVMPFNNVSVYACSGNQTSLKPAPTCTVIGNTNADGKITFYEAPGNTVFFKLSAQYQNVVGLTSTSSPIFLTAEQLTGRTDFTYNLWNFCSITGSTGGSGGN